MHRFDSARALLGMLAVVTVTAGTLQAEVTIPIINPTVTLAPVDITFDTNINSNAVPSELSPAAVNIIRAQNVARQQVQAAIIYLSAHRRDILSGQNTFYNGIFGDFYNPNSQFAGQYDRLMTVPVLGFPLTDAQGNILTDFNGNPLLDPAKDKFGNDLFVQILNTSHYDTVLSTFQSILNAMNQPTFYGFGGPQFDSNFVSYTNANPMIGNPLFGNPAFQPQFDRGFREWGYSDSSSPAHLRRINNNPTIPLLWINDNGTVPVTNPLTNKPNIDPATGKPITVERATALSNLYFKQKLDIYGTQTQTGFDSAGNPSFFQQQFVGQSFLNEQTIIQNGLFDTSVQNQLVPTDLRQYQQLIDSFAQMAGGAEPGLTEIYGSSNMFLQALDSKSYALFAALNPTPGQGVGDGTELPPPGKTGQFLGNFQPVPASLGPGFPNTIVFGN